MATASEISVCNVALGYCGASLITSFNDNTVESNLCEANYSLIRDAVLEDADWSFALKRAELPALANPELGYGNAFQLPVDCLRIIQASPDDKFSHDNRMEWELEDRKILTDQGACFIRYVRQVKDVQRFSPAFIQALGYRIASDLAIPLTKSVALQKQMYGIYDNHMRVARGNDGKQGRSRRMISTWSSNSRRTLPSGRF